MEAFILRMNWQFGQGLVGMTHWLSFGSVQSLGIRIIWNLTHSRVWWLRVLVSWNLSWGCQPEPSVVPLHGLWASSQHGGWVPEEDAESQAESVCHSPLMTRSQKSHIVTFFYSSRLPQRSSQFQEGKYRLFHWRAHGTENCTIATLEK